MYGGAILLGALFFMMFIGGKYIYDMEKEVEYNATTLAVTQGQNLVTTPVTRPTDDVPKIKKRSRKRKFGKNRTRIEDPLRSIEKNRTTPSPSNITINDL